VNIRNRLERLEKRRAQTPCLSLEEMTDHDLCLILARGTTLTPEQVAALPDQDLLALANGLGFKPKRKAPADGGSVRVEP
jgi:hypothetical protein